MKIHEHCQALSVAVNDYHKDGKEYGIGLIYMCVLTKTRDGKLIKPMKLLAQSEMKKDDISEYVDFGEHGRFRFKENKWSLAEEYKIKR